MRASTLRSSIFPPVPTDTAKAAHAIFGRSNFYLSIGDRAEELFAGLIQAAPAERVQRSGRTLAMLQLITFFQFVETLPDHRAVDALRERLDWKYALHLPLNFPCLEETELCEFRKALLSDQISEQAFQALLGRLSGMSHLAGESLQDVPARRMVARVCTFSRLAKIWEAINGALESLATWQPEWLLAVALTHWYDRYGHYRRPLNLDVRGQEQIIFAQAVGADGFYLLEVVEDSGQTELENLAEIATLRRVWREQFEVVEGKVFWRRDACAGCSLPWDFPDPAGGGNRH